MSVRKIMPTMYTLTCNVPVKNYSGKTVKVLEKQTNKKLKISLYDNT